METLYAEPARPADPPIFRVLVCGGRSYADKTRVCITLDKLCVDRSLSGEKDERGNWMPTGIRIIHGGASGADALADDWAVVNWVPQDIFCAQWERDGRAAGPIRNQRMIDEGKPDLVVAFPGGRGTADMVRRARAAGIEVMEIAR